MVDPDKNNQDNAPVEDSDDTKTRKTVRLRPSVTPAGINLTPLPKAPLTDPLSGRDTDTGNLEVMEDTQTRRTVKLKPIATQTAGPSIKPAIPIVGRPAGDGANTQTRKTIVLKPTAVSPASVKVNGPADAAPSDSEDTKTRKTVRLRPSAVTPAGVKIAGEDSESDLDSSDTIKIARPARPGMIPPKVPAPAAPAADPSKATMVLPGHGAEQQSKDGVPVVLLHTVPAARPLPEGTVGPDVPGLKGAGHKPARQRSSAEICREHECCRCGHERCRRGQGGEARSRKRDPGCRRQRGQACCGSGGEARCRAEVQVGSRGRCAVAALPDAGRREPCADCGHCDAHCGSVSEFVPAAEYRTAVPVAVEITPLFSDPPPQARRGIFCLPGLTFRSKRGTFHHEHHDGIHEYTDRCDPAGILPALSAAAAAGLGIAGPAVPAA